MGHPRISDEIKDKAVELVRKGYSVREAGKMLGISETTVYRWIRLKEREEAKRPKVKQPPVKKNFRTRYDQSRYYISRY
jgi:transposase